MGFHFFSTQLVKPPFFTRVANIGLISDGQPRFALCIGDDVPGERHKGKKIGYVKFFWSRRLNRDRKGWKWGWAWKPYGNGHHWRFGYAKQGKATRGLIHWYRRNKDKITPRA